MNDEQQSLLPCFALFRDQFGYVPNLFAAQSAAPHLVQAQADLIANIFFGAGELSRVQKETIALLFAATRQNAYCATLHYRNLQTLGISREKLNKVLEHRPARASSRGTVLLDLAVALAGDRTAVRSCVACACSHWTAKTVMDAILASALSAFFCELSSRMSHAPDFPLLALHPPAYVEPRQVNTLPFDMSTINEAISLVVPNLFKNRRDQPDKSELEVANTAAFREFLATAQITHPSASVSRQFGKDFNDPDRDLVSSAQNGDVVAFSQLVHLHGRGVYRTLISLLGDSDEALDAMQDTYLKAFQALATFQGRSKFSTWLLTIATNVGLQRLREKHPHESLDDTPDDIDAFRPRQLRAWTDNPEEWYSKKESRQLVEGAVRKLPAKYRTVLMMRDIEELSTEDAAAALELSIPALKARLLRGRLMLRETLSMHFGKEREEARS